MDSMYPETESLEVTETDSETMPEGMDEGQETALLPKSIFGKEPQIGNTCTFKVVGIHEDEIEVEYASSDESSETGETEEISMDAKIEAAAI